MKMTNNTILITGGGSGIGRALAEMFHGKGNQVIIAGRRKALLQGVAAANPGMEWRELDIASSESVAQFAETIQKDFPDLNVVIHNAGIMAPERIGEEDIATAEETIAINLTGQIRLNSSLLPLLRTQAAATIITVSSGLAFLPRADYPTYCATKAAIHSYTQSLRTQLAKTSVQVIELIPPYLQTELQGPQQATDERAMPLGDFIAEVTGILESQPDVTEVSVQKVMFLRTAESSGEYEKRYKQFNEGYGFTL